MKKNKLYVLHFVRPFVVTHHLHNFLFICTTFCSFAQLFVHRDNAVFTKTAWVVSPYTCVSDTATSVQSYPTSEPLSPKFDGPSKSIDLFNRAIEYQKRSVATADKRPLRFGIRPTEMRREASGLRHSSDANVAPTRGLTGRNSGLTSAPISPTVLPPRDRPRDLMRSLMDLSSGSDVLTSIAVTPNAIPAG